MAGRGPFKGKQRLDSKRLPKRPKPKASKKASGEGGQPKRRGGMWGIVGDSSPPPCLTAAAASTLNAVRMMG